MDIMEYKPIKQRLFLTLHIGIKNITDKVSSNYIRTQNAERERYYRYQIPIDEVLVSNQKKYTLFPYAAPLTYAMLSDDLKRNPPESPTYITLLQAIEYLAFGWRPFSSKHYDKMYGHQRYYQTSPGSKKGREQIDKLKENCERLEEMLINGLDCCSSGESGMPASKFVEPKVVFDNTNTSFITLTDTTTKTSFNDIKVNFYDLSQSINQMREWELNPTMFRLFLDGNKLKLQKSSGHAKTIHRFSPKFSSYDLIKYIFANEGHSVYRDDPKVKNLIPGGSSNFMTNLKRVFEDNDKRKAKLKKACQR